MADLFPSDLQLSWIRRSAYLAFGDLDNFWAFHFFGDPVQNAILVDISDAAWTFAKSDERFGLFIADSATLLLDLWVICDDFVWEAW